MAIVETVEVDNDPFVPYKVSDEPGQHVHIDLPDWDNPESVQEFWHTLDTLGDARGIKTLRKYANKYLDSTRIAERHLHQVIVSLNTVNGVASPRTGTPGISNELRKFKRASHTYFSGLNTPELRRQCEVFDLDYDSYDTMDEAIAALVDANVAKRNM
jgi:hypothetical protein